MKIKKIKALSIEEARALPHIDTQDLASGNKLQFAVAGDRLFKAGETFTVVGHPNDWQVNVRQDSTGAVLKLGANGMKGMIRA